MFKSIEYKLALYLAALILAVMASTYFFIQREYIFLAISIAIILFSINKLYNHYSRFNKNIIFLLNALENNDYAFNFTEGKIARRERELNSMMNRIKEILVTAKKEVMENERFLSLIIESVSTGIIILNETNHIQNTNRATNQILGMPVFTHLNQLHNLDDSFPSIFQNIRIGDKQQISISNEREQMQVSIEASQIVLRGKILKVITLSNIGNELEAKEMESWIRLIRVMTHEIMNSIAPITSLTDTLLFAYKSEEENERLTENTVEALETISSTAKGLINFVDSYRQFTGVPKPNKSELNLKLLVNNIAKLKESQLKNKKIKLSIHSDEDIYIEADESQISQIILNLIKNASEALAQSQHGEIEIHLAAKLIEVRNNGKPIDKELVANIFIPFFTTKSQGSGIGLSVSRYIMRLHGGNLKHRTEGIWTIFSLEFGD